MARGRKRKGKKQFEGAPSPVSPRYREPSGRPQRKQGDNTVSEAEAKQNRAAAVAGRVNVHKLDETMAVKQEAGTWIGRLYLAGKIGERVYDALVLYAKVSHDMSRVCGTPRVKSGSALDGYGGYDGSSGDDPEHVAWEDRVKKRWAGVRRALLRCGDPVASIVVDGAIRDQPMGDWLDSLVTGGNAVADFFGLPADVGDEAA